MKGEFKASVKERTNTYVKFDKYIYDELIIKKIRIYILMEVI